MKMASKKRRGKEKCTSLNEDFALNLIDLTPLDIANYCPTYMKVLQRAKDGCVHIKELNSLQHDLETIVLNMKKRKENVEEELKTIALHQEKMEKLNFKSKQDVQEKRNLSSENKIPKKHRSDNKQNTGRPKAKYNQLAKTGRGSVEFSVEGLHKPLKSDSPDRFWASLEPYFTEITQDHLKFIEKWMEPDDDDEEYSEIPNLGKHFTYEWSEKVFEEEQQEGAKANENSKRQNNSTYSSKINPVLTDKSTKNVCENTSNPFFQQLMNSLIEEKVIAGLEDAINIPTDLPECEDVPNQSNFIEPPNVNINNMSLEEKIKKDLEKLGILEVKDQNMEIGEAKGDLLEELIDAQVSLNMITKYNYSKKEQLLKLAKEEIQKQETQRKMNYFDSEVMDMIRKNPRKKSLSKKDREHVIKLLKERKFHKNQLKKFKF